jgi:hypothetical protein
MSAMDRKQRLVATNTAQTEIVADVPVASDERFLAMGADSIGLFWLQWGAPRLKRWERLCGRFFAQALAIAPVG